MGLFDDIIRTVQEAVDEAKTQQRRAVAGPVAPSIAERIRAEAEAAARRRIEAQGRAQPQRAAAPAPAAKVSKATKAATRAESARIEAARAARREQERRAAVAASAHLRLLAKLRDPQAIRDAFVLAEILQPPVSLRPQR